MLTRLAHGPRFEEQNCSHALIRPPPYSCDQWFVGSTVAKITGNLRLEHFGKILFQLLLKLQSSAAKDIISHFGKAGCVRYELQALRVMKLLSNLSVTATESTLWTRETIPISQGQVKSSTLKNTGWDFSKHTRGSPNCKLSSWD